MDAVTVIDFETTGLDFAKEDRIVEIGAVKWRDHTITGIYDALVNPGRPIPAEVTKVHGITDSMVAHAAPLEVAIPELLDFIGDDLVVMHNVEFDSGFLSAQMKLLGIERELQYYDTLPAARKKFLGSPNYRLATLKNFLNLKQLGTMHRALADAYVTLQLYLKLENLWAIDSRSQLEKQLRKLTLQREPGARFIVAP
ncbi:MAG TPA: 3'-5' exonuclease [bacterium]|nr:3'-5' exonuclease [bacterium]